jgi:hypothetical protein
VFSGGVVVGLLSVFFVFYGCIWRNMLLYLRFFQSGAPKFTSFLRSLVTENKKLELVHKKCLSKFIVMHHNT